MIDQNEDREILFSTSSDTLSITNRGGQVSNEVNTIGEIHMNESRLDRFLDDGEHFYDSTSNEKCDH